VNRYAAPVAALVANVGDVSERTPVSRPVTDDLPAQLPEVRPIAGVASHVLVGASACLLCCRGPGTWARPA
jgi:hypothetical protein